MRKLIVIRNNIVEDIMSDGSSQLVDELHLTLFAMVALV